MRPSASPLGLGFLESLCENFCWGHEAPHARQYAEIMVERPVFLHQKYNVPDVLSRLLILLAVLTKQTGCHVHRLQFQIGPGDQF